LNKINSILCPFCSSHSVIKKGFKSSEQRYQCKYCHKKFCNTQKHFSYKIIYEFLQNKTLRNFETITKNTLHRAIIVIAKKLPPCVVLNQYLHIKFSGRIGLDAIFVSVEGVSTAVLIAFDLDSLDIIDFGIYDSESEYSWTDFLSNLSKSLNGIYPKIFISDGRKGINNTLRRLYEFVPRQVCVAHKLRRLVNLFPQRDLTTYERLVKDIATKTILSNSLDEFKENEFELLRLVKSPNLRSTNTHESVLEYRKALRARGIVRYQKADFLTQFKYPELVKGDRTNNSLEGSVNSFLKTRTNLFRGFKSQEIFEYWMRLLVFYYRFHKFTSSKYKWRNKRRPIEINWDCDEKKLRKILKSKSYSWIESLTKIS
jgi:hypothetical protein